MKLGNYVVVTAGYWAFTLTDGALRMLVLLHFHDLGYSPMASAFLFLLYEFMGIVTNLLGGWVGARGGLNRTLLAGLGLQIIALVGLTFHEPTWAEWASVAFVMGLQALSGVAKDLTKMSSKSAVKIIAGKGSLFGQRHWPPRRHSPVRRTLFVGWPRRRIMGIRWVRRSDLATHPPTAARRVTDSPIASPLGGRHMTRESRSQSNPPATARRCQHPAQLST